MSIIAIITARGGSKRIPRKNIKEFMGKPMISYAIKAAFDSNIFDNIIVSTDDTEIADIGKKYGAEIPFMRSAATGSDYASTYDVLYEVINKYKKSGIEYDNICCIYPCVPFLNGNFLKESYTKFLQNNYDCLLPVVKYSYPIQRAFIINKDNRLEYREPDYINKRSQDLATTYHDAGMFYFVKAKVITEKNTLIAKNTGYIEIPEIQAQDIDNISDWELAELKYKIIYERNKCTNSD